MKRSLIQPGLIFILLTFTFLIGPVINHVDAFSSPFLSATLCGDGSESDNYGFSYDIQQPHWTVGWENYVTENTVNQVDGILDKLNNDSIAQTMILFKDQTQVGNQVNCAVHFLRYMKLGLSYGERKDNGFAFLIVVDPNKINVHYGVGLGLPALTAPELTNLNRLAEDTYQSTQNMDAALLALIKGFDEVTRKKYSPLISTPATQPTSIYIQMPTIITGPLDTGVICCLVCIGMILLIGLFIFLTRFGRFLRWFPTFPGSDRGGGSSPWSGPSSGGGGPVMRGGGGSGRSNRGN